jgi:DNA ligase D
VLSGLLVEDLRDAEPETPDKSADKKVARIKAARIAGAVRAEMPSRVAPQLATQTDSPPEGDDWVHEIKYDGYRTICLVENGKARLFTRNQHDWTHRYGAVAKAFAELDCKSAVIDGEIVVQDARGATSIASLETALSESRDSSLVYFAFDLIHLDGYDLSAARLIDRKAALAGLIGPRDPRSTIQLSEHFAGSGAELFAHVCRMGLEGIISKRIDARYEQRRTKTWTKLKRSYVSEFIVVGFTSTFPERVAALVLAEETADGALAFVCRVSSGLTDKTAKEQFERLSAFKISKPLVEAPKIPNVVWTEPAAIARIAFNSRAADGAPRQPVLLDILPYKKAARSTKPKLVADRDLAAIRLTNPERPMFGESGATKLDIALYYARVGDWMLPEILRRPLSFIRCTTGELEDCFFQRHAFAGLPPGMSTIKLSAEEGRGAFIYVESAQGFLTLTQFGAVEFHPWACRADEPEEPDRFILDLDPDVSVPWPQIRAAAELLRGRLQDLGFTPFVRTTGRKGLHLVMALAPGCKWPDLRAFAEAVSASAAKDAPQVFTNSQSMERRKGRIYLDWIRNVRGATAIASYSLRANAELTASCPLDWDELRTLSSPAAFDRKTLPKRLATLAKDPWEDLEASAVSISAKAKREVGIKN